MVEQWRRQKAEQWGWKGDGGIRSRYIADYIATVHFTDTEGSYDGAGDESEGTKEI